tara:strand:+ start:1077 stop:1553 length:477 start_codon:yes stop_codon:yes gene_type:complete
MNWIDEFEKSEEGYNDLYKESLENIDVFLVYINKDKEIFHIKNTKLILNEGILDKANLIYTLRKYRIYNEKKYVPLSLIKYNISLEPNNVYKYLHVPENYDFMTLERYIHSIKWEDCITMFHDINSLHIIFYEVNTHKHNTTKKVYIKNNTKTRRKYI